MVAHGPKDFIALGDLVASEGGYLGVTAKHRHLHSLTITGRNKSLLFSEKIIDGDIADAARRLLARLRRKGGL